MGDKDIISKELLKEMAKDISRHILHIKNRGQHGANRQRIYSN